MTQQIAELLKNKNKVFYFKDVLSVRIGNRKNTTKNKYKLQKIMYEYFKIVLKNILNGYLVELPYNMGTIGVYKIKSYDLTNKEVIRYTIKWDSDVFDKFHMKLKASRDTERKIENLVITQNKDYRYYDRKQ